MAFRNAEHNCYCPLLFYKDFVQSRPADLILLFVELLPFRSKKRSTVVIYSALYIQIIYQVSSQFLTKYITEQEWWCKNKILKNAFANAEHEYFVYI